MSLDKVREELKLDSDISFTIEGCTIETEEEGETSLEEIINTES